MEASEGRRMTKKGAMKNDWYQTYLGAWKYWWEPIFWLALAVLLVASVLWLFVPPPEKEVKLDPAYPLYVDAGV